MFPQQNFLNKNFVYMTFIDTDCMLHVCLVSAEDVCKRRKLHSTSITYNDFLKLSCHHVQNNSFFIYTKKLARPKEIRRWNSTVFRYKCSR